MKYKFLKEVKFHVLVKFLQNIAHIWLLNIFIGGFPGSSDGKESACNAGDPGSGRSPGEENWQPTPVFLPGEFHGQTMGLQRPPWLSD